MKVACENCHYMDLVAGFVGDVRKRVCRRYPDPVEKRPLDWCGEFQPKKED